MRPGPRITRYRCVLLGALTAVWTFMLLNVAGMTELTALLLAGIAGGITGVWIRTQHPLR